MPDTEPQVTADTAKQTSPLFIDGWLTDQYAAGRRPVFSEPLSPLPEVRGGPMEVVPGYLAGSR